MPLLGKNKKKEKEKKEKKEKKKKMTTTRQFEPMDLLRTNGINLDRLTEQYTSDFTFRILKVARTLRGAGGAEWAAAGIHH